MGADNQGTGLKKNTSKGKYYYCSKKAFDWKYVQFFTFPKYFNIKQHPIRNIPQRYFSKPLHIPILHNNCMFSVEIQSHEKNSLEKFPKKEIFFLQNKVV